MQGNNNFPIDKLDILEGFLHTWNFFDFKYNNMVKVPGFLSFANTTPFVAVHRLSVHETK